MKSLYNCFLKGLEILFIVYFTSLSIAFAQEDEASFEFLNAVEARDYVLAEKWLGRGVDVNVKNSNGMTALTIAASHGNVEFIRKLIERGANINVQDNDGKTALIWAIEEQFPSICQLLIEKGADLELKDTTFRSAICYVSTDKLLPITQMMLNKGATLDCPFAEPLFSSICNNEGVELSLFLLEKYQKLDLQNYKGEFILHETVECNNQKAMEWLIAHQADVNFQDLEGNTPLHIAAREQKADWCKYLIERGAKIELKNKKGVTPLYEAIRSGSEPDKMKSTVAYLLSQGASPNILDNKNWTAMERAVSKYSSENFKSIAYIQETLSLLSKNTSGELGLKLIEAVKQKDSVQVVQLISQGANLNSIDAMGVTPFMWSVFHREYSIANLLYEKGADAELQGIIEQSENIFRKESALFNEENYYGSALSIAASLNDVEMLQFLIEDCKLQVDEEELPILEGFSVFQKRGWTPLLRAIYFGNLDACNYLVSQNADVNIEINTLSPLHLAVLTNNEKIVKFLLEKGAKTDFTSKNDVTPLHIASQLGNYEICKMLIKAGADVNAITKDYLTPIEYAINSDIKRKADIILLLIEHGAEANVDEYTNKQPILVQVCALGNPLLVKRLIDKGADVNVIDEYGKTPLIQATISGSLDICLLLIKHNADIGVMDFDGKDALTYAIAGNHTKIMELILATEKTQNKLKKKEIPHLGIAILHGHLNSCSILLKYGWNLADVIDDFSYDSLSVRKKSSKFSIFTQKSDNFSQQQGNLSPNFQNTINDFSNNSNSISYGGTPLMLAVKYQNDNIPLILFLLNNKANAWQCVNYLNAFSIAASNGNNKLLEILLENKPLEVKDFNNYCEDGVSAIQMAWGEHQAKTVQWLLEKGAKIDWHQPETHQLYFEAMERNEDEIVQFFKKNHFTVSPDELKSELLFNALPLKNITYAKKLLDEGVDPNADRHINYNLGVSYEGKSALMLAVESNDSTFCQLLLDKGANVNASSDDSDTALMLAVLNNNFGITKLLLDNNANKFAINDKGLTSIDIALMNENEKIARLLVGNEVFEKYLKNKPLFDAILWGNYSEVEQIINTGADVNALNLNGQTPLMVAASFERKSILELLLNKGANTEIKDPNDKNIEDYVKEQGYQTISSFVSGKIPTLYFPNGHTAPINAVDYSFDGNYILSASEDRTLRIWEAQSGKEITNLLGHTHTINDAKFSPTHHYILSASADKTLRLWDIVSRKSIKILSGHTEEITSIDISKNGLYAISGSLDKTIKIWDLKKGTTIKTFSMFNNPIENVYYSFSNNEIIAFDRFFVYIISISQGTIVQKIETTECVVSEGGKFVFYKHIPQDNIITVPTEKGKVSRKEKGKNTITDFSNLNNAIYRIEVGTENIERIVEDGFILAATPDGKRLAVYKDNFLTNDNQIIIKQFPENKILTKTVCNRSFSKPIISFSPKEYKWIFAASINEFIQEVNGETGEITKTYKGNVSKLFRADFFADNDSLTWRTIENVNNNHLFMMQLRTGKITKSPESEDNSLYFIHTKAQYKHLLAESNLQFITLRDTISKKSTKWAAHGGIVQDIKFSSDGTQLITASDDNTIAVWEVNTFVLKQQDTTQEDRVLPIYQARYLLKGHNSNVLTANISADEKYIVSGGADYVGKIWDTSTLKDRRTLRGHYGAVTHAYFHGNKKHIITASANVDLYYSDNTIRFWNAQTGREIAVMMILGENDWVVKSPTGLFDASEGAMKQLYFLYNLETIELEQLKERYYQPGLLQIILGYKDEDLRNVEALKGTIPLYPEVEVTQVNKNGKFEIKLNNRGGGIGQVKIFINGKEIASDARGEKADPNAKELELKQDIDNHPYIVPNQENIIEVKAYNGEGWLVSRGVKVRYQPEASKEVERPRLFLLAFGVSDYTGDQIDLKFAAKDAEDAAKAIEIGGKRLFGTEKTFKYILTTQKAIPEEQPFKKNIQEVFKKIAKEAKSTDVIVVYLAGHGINWGGQDGDFFYLTKDAYTANVDAYNDPAIRQTCTLSSSELVELIKGVPALKQVLLIDACASGRAVENLMAKRDIPSSTIRALDRMKDRTGMHILTGCAADAVSYEASRFGQGLLTYSIIEGIKGMALKEEKYVDISRLMQYARDRVPQLATGIGGIQEPQTFSPYGAESFDIGELTDQDKAEVPLARVRPVFVRTSFQDESEMLDVLQLAKLVDEALNEVSAKGEKSAILFMDARDYPEGYTLAGRYKIDANGNITLRLKLKTPQETSKFDLSGKNTAELVDKILKLVDEKVRM